MRRFSAAYLRRTRQGMWADSVAALTDLELGSRERILDVGCGTGELTRVLAAESGAEVVGVDADRDLLSVAADVAPVAAGDAARLPFADDSFDLVACQALLINLPDPGAAVREFARVSSDLVAAVEPDNSDVSVTSTVEGEPGLTARAREAFLAGAGTDLTLGGEATAGLFADADLRALCTRRYRHENTTEPPYSEAELADARRKATGRSLDDQRAALLATMDEPAYDDLRADWRAMGRAVVDQMGDERYRRRETIPFYVTVGTVADGNGTDGPAGPTDES